MTEIISQSEQTRRRHNSAVQRVRDTPYGPPVRARRSPIIGGGGGEPPRFLKISLYGGGSITGSFTLRLGIRRPDGGMTRENITIPVPATLLQVATAFESHSLVEPGQFLARATAIDHQYAPSYTGTNILPTRAVFIGLEGKVWDDVEIDEQSVAGLGGGYHTPYIHLE